MPDGPLDATRRDLEAAFYRDEAAEHRDRLSGNAADGVVAALREASGIDDAETLAQLAGLGIRPETLAALTLIPLVEVAWADDRMQAKEEAAVLAGAESTGIEEDSPSHALLRIWIRERPPVDLTDAWRAYIRALCTDLTQSECERLRANVLGRARLVAEAAGGFLGLGNKVSPVEEEALASLATVFGS